MSLTIINKQSNKEISQRKLETYEKYMQIINWGRAYPVEFCSRFMGVELLDLQKYAIYNAWFSEFIAWLESRNAGKALSLNTPIPTPLGIKTIADIKVNDYVYGIDGKPTKVVAISDVFVNHKCYEITFDDGEKIVADENHLWDVQTKSMRAAISQTPKTNRKRVNFEKIDAYGFKTISTKDMVEDFVHKRKDNKGNNYKYKIPAASPIFCEEKELPIPPYTLGVWLGDGSSSGISVTSSMSDSEETASYIENDGYCVKRKIYKSKPTICVLYIKGKEEYEYRSLFLSQLKQNNLYNNKHIPETYFNSSISQRLELLQGLMDTDGACDKSGKYCEFAQKSKKLADDFCRLLNSLSIQYSITERFTKCNNKQFKSYRIIFHTTKELPCFKMRRKYDRLLDCDKHNRHKLKTIINIQEVKSVPTKCIRVENERGLFLCGSKNTVTHNSTKLAIYTMLRSLLIPFHATYFLGNTGEQAKETFKKIEKLAKKEIESFAGCTDIFFNELVRNGSTSDGFVHNPASFVCQLFNGANINTLNSDVINIKGKRANLVCFDEAGWFPDELFVQAENFVNQDENFKLGGNIDIKLEPKGFPRQLMYASSASDTSSEFYKKLKLFSQQMIMGNRKYFCCNFTIDMVMSAKFNGEPYPPLISKDKVDKALSDNHDKAMRELYNKFSADSHEGQILTRRDLLTHTKNRPPLLCNDTGNRIFVFAWDSARLNDNSVIEIAEFIQDEEIGWIMNLHNVISLVDISTKKKTPKRIPEQVNDFKSLLLKYNGSEKGKLDYENIKAVICDSGAGGQMVGGVSDYLVEDWVGNDSKKHKGIIDRKHKANETAKNKYPDAVDIMKLIDPKGNRNAIFDSIEKMVKLGVVTFPAEYDGRDYLYYINDDGTEEKYDLNTEEKISLTQIELLKTEIITMCKYENTGNITYNFPPDKRNTMHDDRVFAFGLLCYYLAQLRHGDVINKPNIPTDYKKMPSFVSNISF